MTMIEFYGIPYPGIERIVKTFDFQAENRSGQIAAELRDTERLRILNLDPTCWTLAFVCFSFNE